MYANRSETYEAFQAIDGGAYKEKIQFIEENFLKYKWRKNIEKIK